VGYKYWEEIEKKGRKKERWKKKEKKRWNERGMNLKWKKDKEDKKNRIERKE